MFWHRVPSSGSLQEQTISVQHRTERYQSNTEQMIPVEHRTNDTIPTQNK